METPLLQTKFYIPQPQTSYIPRPHLLERINEGMDRKLTLITAPAGFGKTSLLSQWASQSRRPVSWLSLDDDDEVSRFFSYFIVALQKIHGHIGVELLTALQTSQSAQINTLLALLVNEIGLIETDFSLILDDYHVISTTSIHEALVFVLDHSPPTLHLIVAGRQDPFFPISRYRAKGNLIELRMEDLRFSPEETGRYLNQVIQLDLTEEDILVLDSRTEGWISGIHLAALSMQGHEAPSQFIAALAGDDRYILDYLVDEVLLKRPKGTRDFLIKTSILERLNAPLCDAVTGAADGRALLSSLEQANLFIIPLDNRRRWYRYHRLFADLLYRLLQETLVQHQIVKLHQLASQWFEENGFVFEAVDHSLAAQDYESVIRLIKQDVDEIFATGQLVPLTKYWNQLSQEHLLRHPELCMIFCWAWLATGHPQEADDCLRKVESSYGASVSDLVVEGDTDVGLSDEAFGALIEVAVIRSQLALMGGDIAEALELSKLALPLLENEEVPYLYTPPLESRTVVYFNLGLGHEFLGELAAAESALKEALNLARKVGNIHIIGLATGHLAIILRINGDIPSAIQVCERGIMDLQKMTGRSPMSGVLLSAWGHIAYEQDNLEFAQGRFEEAIGVAKLWGLWEALIPGYVGLARVYYAHGDVDGAFQALDELESLGKDNPERVMPAVKSARAMLWVLEGNLEAALNWVQTSGLDLESEIGFTQEEDYILLVRVLIATNRRDEADRLLGRLVAKTEAGKRDGRLIELLVLRAMSLVAQNNASAALETISRALQLAKPSGYMRIFLNEGAPMADLLRLAHADGIESDFTRKLLLELKVHAEGPSGDVVGPDDDGLHFLAVEPLSERELEVLRWLNTDLAGPEIARELMIALSTLRTHTQHIFSKLNVNSRRAAVRRAADLNLL